MIRRVAGACLLIAATAGFTVAPTATQAVPTRVVHTVASHAHGPVGSERTFVLGRAASDVAVYWRGNPQARVSVALGDERSFGPPQPAGRDDIGVELHDRMTYGALQHAGGATRVRVTTDRPLADLWVLGLSDGAAEVRHDDVAPLNTATAATTQPPVRSRAQWGADPALMTWAPAFYETKKLIVHHTATSDDYVDQAGAEAQIRSIYYYHSVTQGWGDIGYNFLIDKFGTIYEGRYSRDYSGADPSGDDERGFGVTGAHTSGWNSGTVGVALLGTLTTHDATPAARASLEQLLAWEASRNGIDPQASSLFVNPVSGASITTPDIAGHRDYAATACPGDTFYPTLPAVRADVAAMVAGGSPAAPADTTAPTAPSQLVATGGRGTIDLTWSAATDDVGVRSYQVWRRRSGTTGFTQVGTTGTTRWTDSGLKRRTRFDYRVRATDAAGNLGAWSSTVSATTT